MRDHHNRRSAIQQEGFLAEGHQKPKSDRDRGHGAGNEKQGSEGAFPPRAHLPQRQCGPSAGNEGEKAGK